MPADFTITLTPGAQTILAQFESLPRRMMTALRKSLDQQNELTISTMVQNRLNSALERGVKNTTPDLRSISHRLRDSFNRGDKDTASEAASVEGDTVTSAIGSVVKYAAVHEYGGTFSYAAGTRATSKLVKFLVRQKVLPTFKGLADPKRRPGESDESYSHRARQKTAHAKRAFEERLSLAQYANTQFKTRRVQGAQVAVRAHQKTFPGRLYLTETIIKRTPQYSAALSEAIERTWEEME